MSFSDPIAKEHAKYYRGLYGAGVVIQGGPFPGYAGGMMIFNKNLSTEEIIVHANEDPAVKSGVLAYEIKNWLRVFGD